MGRLRCPQREVFAREMAWQPIRGEKPNQTAAAIKAGFSARSAHNQGWRLMSEDDVRKRIDEVRDAAFDAAEITPEWIEKAYLKELADCTNSRDRKSILDSLAKCRGMFTENVGVTQKVDAAAALKQLESILTPEQVAELEKRLAIQAKKGAKPAETQGTKTPEPTTQEIGHG